MIVLNSSYSEPPGEAASDAFGAESRRELESAWDDLEEIFEICALNLPGRTLLEVREARETARICWREAARALPRGGTEPVTTERVRENIGAIRILAVQLRDLNERALLNPYARLDGSAALIPSEGALAPRTLILPHAQKKD